MPATARRLAEVVFTADMVVKRFRTDDLAEPLRGGFRVPPQAVAYLTARDGRRRVARGGQEVRGRHEVALVRDGAIPLTFALRAPTAARVEARVLCDLEVEIDHADAESLRSFLEWFPGHAFIFVDALRLKVEPSAREAIAAFVATLPPEGLHRLDRAAAADAFLKTPLARLHFERGVRFRGCTRWASTVPGVAAASRRAPVAAAASSPAPASPAAESGQPDAGEAGAARPRSGTRGRTSARRGRAASAPRAAERRATTNRAAKPARGTTAETRARRVAAQAREEAGDEAVRASRRRAEAARAAREEEEQAGRLELARRAISASIDRLDTEARADLARIRHGAAMEMTARLREAFGADTLDYYLSQIHDDHARAEVLKRLLSRDLSPDQIRALAESDHASSAAGGVAAPAPPPLPAGWLVVAAEKGVKAYHVGPGKNPRLTLDMYWSLENAPLSPLRAISVARAPGGPAALWFGGAAGVAEADARGGIAGLYRLPGGAVGEPSGAGGVNAVALTSRFVYGASSDAGVVRWRLGHPGEPGVPLFDRLTEHAGVVRGFAALEGRLAFAADRAVWSFDDTRPEDTLARLGETEAGIGALALCDRWLVAGDRRGGLYAADFGARRPALALLSREPGAIRHLRPARIDGLSGALACGKERGALFVDPDTRRRVYFRAGEEVRSASAAEGWVAGLTRDGGALLLWAAASPSEPAARATLPAASRLFDYLPIASPSGPA
ncbi:MAG: hypothetical protein HY719_00885 [Planctomycetes bacterium]|nr:hypothetical protein [Planctomycetota bacterium]